MMAETSQHIVSRSTHVWNILKWHEMLKKYVTKTLHKDLNEKFLSQEKKRIKDV